MENVAQFSMFTVIFVCLTVPHFRTSKIDLVVSETGVQHSQTFLIFNLWFGLQKLAPRVMKQGSHSFTQSDFRFPMSGMWGSIFLRAWGNRFWTFDFPHAEFRNRDLHVRTKSFSFLTPASRILECRNRKSPLSHFFFLVFPISVSR